MSKMLRFLQNLAEFPFVLLATCKKTASKYILNAPKDTLEVSLDNKP
jgi:hypothetical protein